jgi:hypothetical protein
MGDVHPTPQKNKKKQLLFAAGDAKLKNPAILNKLFKK